MIKIIKANKTHINELKKIWKVCFGDSDEYIDFFFENRFDTCHCISVICDDEVAGGAYLLPVTACEYGEIKKGFYGYAIGVLPQYRGNGLYAMIDSYIENYILQNNMFYILCPANEKLCSYYKSLGFTENAFTTKETIRFSGENIHLEAVELIASDCMSMRNEFFDNIIYWDENAIEYVLRENIFTGGENLKIFFDNNTFYLIVRRYDNCITVTESNICENYRQKITDFLCTKYNTNDVLWILPDSKKDSPQLYGLSKNLNEKGYYLNFILN